MYSKIDHLIFRGAGMFLKKVCFHIGAKKNKMSSTKLKINSLFFIQQISMGIFVRTNCCITFSIGS